MKCHKGMGYGFDNDSDTPDTQDRTDKPEDKSFEDYESEVRAGKRKLDPNQVGFG